MARPNQACLGLMVAFCFRDESRKKGLKSGVGEGNKWCLLAGRDGNKTATATARVIAFQFAASRSPLPTLLSSKVTRPRSLAAVFRCIVLYFRILAHLSLGLSLSAYNRFILR